jgi:hypothetical protein
MENLQEQELPLQLCIIAIMQKEDTKPSFQRGHSESFVYSPPRKGIMAKRYKSGSFALSLVACPDFRFLLCAKTRQRNQGRGMALRVFNYSQVMFMSPCTYSDSLKVGLAILMFVFEWLLVIFFSPT